MRGTNAWSKGLALKRKKRSRGKIRQHRSRILTPEKPEKESDNSFSGRVESVSGQCKEKWFTHLLKTERKTLFKRNDYNGGFAVGERDGPPLQVQQGKVEIYSQWAGWEGSVDGKLWGGSILIHRGSVAEPTWQDSCWRQARVIPYWGWGLRNLIRYRGWEIFAKLTQQDSCWKAKVLVRERTQEPDSSLVKGELSLLMVINKNEYERFLEPSQFPGLQCLPCWLVQPGVRFTSPSHLWLRDAMQGGQVGQGMKRGHPILT